MTRTAGVLLLAVGWAITSPSLARADDPKSAQDAQARFDEGIARARHRDFDGARIAFTEAYAVLKKYDILFNLALAEEKSGHTVDALTHFKQLARDTQGSADDRVTSHKHATELAAHTGHIDVAAPPGAGIVLDGSVNVGTTPLSEPLDVQPGSHKVEARARDRSYAVTVNATVGDIVKANFLDVIPPDAPMPLPPTAATPAAPATATAPTPPPPDTTTPPAHDSFWTPRTITVVAIGGAAVVGIAGGIFFGAEAHSDSSKADTLRATIGSEGCASSSNPNCAALASTVSSSNSEKTTSTVFYVAGGVLAAGAVATWFLWPKSTSGDGASAVVVPSVGRDGAGLNVLGRF